MEVKPWDVFEVRMTVFNRGPATAESVVVGFYGDVPRLVECKAPTGWADSTFMNLKRCEWPIPPQLAMPSALRLTINEVKPVRLQINLHAHDNPVQVAELLIGENEIERMRGGEKVSLRLEGRTTDWQPDIGV